MSGLTSLTKEQLATLTVGVSNTCPTCGGWRSIASLPKCPECGQSHILRAGRGLPCNPDKQGFILAADETFAGWHKCYECGGSGRVTEWIPLAEFAEAMRKLLTND